MDDCKDCEKCKGEKVGTYCIVKNGEKHKSESFDALIDTMYSDIKSLKDKKSNIDWKTLSTGESFSDEQGLQLLIDREVKRSKAVAPLVNNGIVSNEAINSNLLNRIAALELEVKQLKQLL